MSKKIRFGVFGLERGLSLISCILSSGGQVVAICDHRPAQIAKAKEQYSQCQLTEYDDFEAFINHDMDAVLLCNYFCEHAQYAIRAMRAGKHVLSETISNITMAEGVALCRTKEETGMTYALLENYPYFKENRKMGEIYNGGTLGNLVYGEGEYSHPMSMSEQNNLAPGERHWRNWTPRTYYSTHALAPLMQMTGATPTRVTGMASFQPEGAKGTALRTGDAAAIILCQTDTNAVFRVIGWANHAPHGNFYRLSCTRGGVDFHKCDAITLTYNSWQVPEGMEESQELAVLWKDFENGELAEKAGHGGGDFFAIYYFIKDLEEGNEPFWNVYRATTASSVAILAWRSILNNNVCYDVPDFKREEDRKKYENDTASPYPDENYHADIPCSSKPYAPTAQDLQIAYQCWQNADFQVK